MPESTTPSDSPRVHWNEPSDVPGDFRVDPRVAPFHAKLPGYAPTPLRSAPSAARALGVRSVWVKDESLRLGLPAYKILGASWATYRALDEHVHGFTEWSTLDDLARQLDPFRPLELTAATDGNHGRAVARMARWLGLNAHILVPEGMAAARVTAIREEGARVSVVHGTYDDAVLEAAKRAGPRTLVISDTAWEGYERVPRWVVEGYATIFTEIDAQLEEAAEPGPNVVAAQIGVGALAAAVILHYRRGPRPAHVVGVEPTRAACMLTSVEAGEPTDVPGPHDSIMAGLNCGRPSPVAWPVVSAGASAFVAIPDARAEEAMRLLALDGIESGESGAAGLAGLLELLGAPRADESRRNLHLDEHASILVVSTEGATDPDAYARIVTPHERGAST